MRNFIFLIVIKVILVFNLYGESLTTGADFLKVGIGSKDTAMGGATTALVEDIESLNVNISGLSRLEVVQLLLEHSEMFEGFRYERVAASLPINNFIDSYNRLGKIGIGFTYFYMPGFDRYGDWGEVVGQVKFSSYKLSLGYSREIIENRKFILSGGSLFSMVGKNVNTVNRISAGVDIGAQGEIFHKVNKIFGKSLRVGLNIKNIGFSGYGYNENLPMVFQFGIGTKVYNIVSVEIDGVKYLNGLFLINMGAEYVYKNMISIRIGGNISDDILLKKFSTGIGIRYKLFSKDMYFDYAMIPFSKLGITHRISLKIDLSESESESKGIKEGMDDIYYYKGVRYFMNSDYKNAIKMWKKTLEINPGYSKVRERIKELRRLIKWESEQKKLEEGFKKVGRGVE